MPDASPEDVILRRPLAGMGRLDLSFVASRLGICQCMICLPVWNSWTLARQRRRLAQRVRDINDPAQIEEGWARAVP